MYDFIKETYYRLVEAVEAKRHRYLYAQFHTKNRLVGLIGPRGVGKTTLLLQYIKEHLYQDKKTFYFSADLVFFRKKTLLEFVSELYQHEGIRNVFIDEIHKYPNWNQEIKNLYDAFPDLTLVFSGSSMLDLIAGSHDLSRRAKLYHLKGMSFREYINFITNDRLPAIGYEKLLQGERLRLPESMRKHFHDYLVRGYYPFLFEDPQSHLERLVRIIDKTIFEDIANYYNLKTPHLHYFKTLLRFMASIPPGELNINKLAQNLEVDHKTASHYLTILTDVGLARLLFPYHGGNAVFRKPAKMYLNNTTLMHAMATYIGEEISRGTIRELFFLQSVQDADHGLYYSKQGDFRTTKEIFEIGGKNKSKKQIRNADLPAYLVKDDISFPSAKEIPLHYFGFLY